MNKLANPNLIFPDQVLQVPDIEVKEEVKEEPTAPVVEEPSTPVVEEPTTPVVEETEEVKAELTNLTVEDITLTGNAITPEFTPEGKQYTFNVQSDIYAVKVTPEAPEGATVTVAGEEVKAGESAIINLSQEYADSVSYTHLDVYKRQVPTSSVNVQLELKTVLLITPPISIKALSLIHI